MADPAKPPSSYCEGLQGAGFDQFVTFRRSDIDKDKDLPDGEGFPLDGKIGFHLMLRGNHPRACAGVRAQSQKGDVLPWASIRRIKAQGYSRSINGISGSLSTSASARLR